jgi:hypothetical protein
MTRAYHTLEYAHTPDGQCMSYKCQCELALKQMAAFVAKVRACRPHDWKAGGITLCCRKCGISVDAAPDYVQGTLGRPIATLQ